MATILSADVAGYSWLIAGDERRTDHTLAEYRHVFGPRVKAR